MSTGTLALILVVGLIVVLGFRGACKWLRDLFEIGMNGCELGRMGGWVSGDWACR
jgi:hypothetical protein